MQNGWRKTRYWEWAKEWSSLFHDILPKHVCEAAMATCRFQLRGLDSHGNKWGNGFLTFMQTFGHAPTGLTNDVQMRCNWIELDAHESANLILGCFGMTTDDVYEYFGTPAKDEELNLDLHEIVTMIDANFAATAVAATAVA